MSWVTGGAQGSGVDSAANIFSRACAIGGLHLFGKREYYSNIKGQHSYFTVRVSERPVHSHVNEINMLVSFDAETVFRHFTEVTQGGGIIYDTDMAETTIDEVPTIDDYAADRIKKTLEKAGLGCTVHAGEWAGADRGLGYLVNLARGSLFDIPLMFATLVTIAAIGVLLYLGVVLLERVLVGAWR